MTTPVIFRKWPKSEGGDVIAFFPADAGTNDYYNTCSSYEHVGQHGSASVDLINTLKPAKPAEYADLKEELERIGYDDLKVYQRLQPSFLELRSKQIQRIDEPVKAAKKAHRKRSKGRSSPQSISLSGMR